MRGNRESQPGWNERGAVAVFTVIFILVAMVLLAFVIDRGRVYLVQSQMQNAVDAAALAGARELCVDQTQARGVALQYADDNGLNALDDSVPAQETGEVRVTEPVSNGDYSYINVSAAKQVDLLFGPFVRAESLAVAVQATAQRLCLSQYQFVADVDFNFTAGGDIKGGIYAGQCFQGKGGTFSLVAVSTDDDPAYDCSPFHNGDLAIDNSPKSPVCNNAASVGECLFNQSTSTAIAFAKIFGATPATYRSGVTDTGTCSTLDFSADINCTGDVDIPTSQMITNDVIATGDITTKNDTTFAPPTYDSNGQVNNRILLYSVGGTIDLKMDGVPANVVVYAPTDPSGGDESIKYAGSGANLDGILLGRTIKFAGGNVEGGTSVALRGAGAVSLIQ